MKQSIKCAIVAGVCLGIDASAMAATRELPSVYVAGETLVVTIVLEVPDGTSAVGLDDAPPEGWVVDESSISNAGFWDPVNSKVKWGPYFTFPVEVSYSVMPPEEAEGEACFEGTISLDGLNEVIGGDICVSSCVCPDDGVFCNGVEECNLAGECASSGDPCAGAVCCETTGSCAVECCDAAECDDQDACTEDECVDGSCVNTDIVCPDDGAFCNGLEQCDSESGNCVSSGDPCAQVGICCEADEACAVECCGDDDCDDQDSCTDDACSDGVCENTVILCADDGVFCNGAEQCDPEDGQCVSSGDPCDQVGVCCEPAQACRAECCEDAECGDGVNCTEDACVEGVCENVPVDCADDGVFCNGEEFCDPDTGECMSGGDPCAGELCCEESESCVSECCVDADCPSSLCEPSTCDAGLCMVSPVMCPDDGVFCNGTEACDENTGECVSVDPPCDGQICCEDAAECAEECCFNSDCPDDQCEMSMCAEGLCVQTEVECQDDGVFCNGMEMCDPATGQCASDGNPCSELCCENSDTCAEECCQHAECNDGKNCTVDTCFEGGCVFEPVQCAADGEFCNGIELCDPLTGQCVSSGDPCMYVGICCEEKLLCAAECCSEMDCPSEGCASNVCDHGVCIEEEVECPEDGVFCNGVEECDEDTGECISPGDPCAAGQICCEDTDTCLAECCGVEACDDGESCTDDSCAEGVCVHDDVIFDLNGDGLTTVAGDLAELATCFLLTNLGDPDAVEQCCSAGNCLCRLDCNSDGFVSVAGDLPCWRDCFFFGLCERPE